MTSLDDFKNGQVLLIDKPLDWTSFQVVNKLRWAIRKHFKIKKIKVGHAGTLDPLATGLLIICTGKKTKEIDQLQAEKKEYTGTITLGATTPSYDLETAIDQTFPIDHISEKDIMSAAEGFIGKQEQLPPIFSALKKDGVRLYELARKGEKTKIEPRNIEIQEFEITQIKAKDISFRIVCSKGTYIRSIAHDFGKALNSGAHLTALRRTKSGNHHVDKALSIEQFLKELESSTTS